MAGLSAADLLAVWEGGRSQHPAARALTILAAASPGTPVEELATMPLGRRDARLLALREASFGPTVAGTAECAACGEPLELGFPAPDVFPDGGAGVEPVTYEADGYRVVLRPPDTTDLLAIAGHRDVAEARTALLARCVQRASADGKALALSDLPPAVADGAAAALAEADPRADVWLATPCPACGESCSVAFDVASFLWEELAMEAEALLLDVHALAAAYGWREADILALPASRRRAYLELVEG